MNREIRQDGNNSWLCVPAKPETARAYQLKILNYNQPEQLLSLHYVNRGNDSFLEYPVSGLISLKDAAGSELLFDYMHSLIFALERLSLTLGEYLLDIGEVLLSPEDIFLQTETGRIYFCYVPGESFSVQEALQKLMEFFMKEMNPVREHEVLLLYGLFQKSREPNVTAPVLAEYWRDLERRLELREEQGTEGGPGNAVARRDPGGQAAAVAFPKDREASEEDAILKEIGLSAGRPPSLFREWQEAQQAQAQERTEGQEMRRAGMTDMTEGQEYPAAGKGGKPQRPGTARKAESVRKTKKAEPAGAGGLKEAIAGQIREHSFELGIGVIVAVGVIVFLFM